MKYCYLTNMTTNKNRVGRYAAWWSNYLKLTRYMLIGTEHVNYFNGYNKICRYYQLLRYLRYFAIENAEQRKRIRLEYEIKISKIHAQLRLCRNRESRMCERICAYVLKTR